MADKWRPIHIKFEEALRERLGTKHCITVANCTLGLMLAGRAAGLTGEVIMPSFTFVATAHAMSWMGVTPVFCDIDPETYQMDPQAIEALITPRTTGIMGVHLFGRMCDVDALEKIAAAHNLKLLIDGAQAMGCSTPNRSVGTAGDAVVISFHATKVMNTFEGGVIATNNDDIARSTRLMRNFGFVDVDRVDCLGINAKMSEPAAAMGLTSLDALDSFIDVNRSNFDRYRQVLSDIPGIVIRDHNSAFTSNYQYRNS